MGDPLQALLDGAMKPNPFPPSRLATDQSPSRPKTYGWFCSRAGDSACSVT